MHSSKYNRRGLMKRVLIQGSITWVLASAAIMALAFTQGVPWTSYIRIPLYVALPFAATIILARYTGYHSSASDKDRP